MEGWTDEPFEALLEVEVLVGYSGEIELRPSD